MALVPALFLVMVIQSFAGGAGRPRFEVGATAAICHDLVAKPDFTAGKPVLAFSRYKHVGGK